MELKKIWRKLTLLSSQRNAQNSLPVQADLNLLNQIHQTITSYLIHFGNKFNISEYFIVLNFETIIKQQLKK
jgi:hypothetical protein